MSINFDIRKFLTENEVTAASQDVATKPENVRGNPPFTVFKTTFPNGSTCYNYSGATIQNEKYFRQYQLGNAQRDARLGSTLSPYRKAWVDTEDKSKIKIDVLNTHDTEKAARKEVDSLNNQDTKSIRKRVADTSSQVKKKVAGKKDTSSIKGPKPVGLALGQKFDWKSVDPKTLSPHQAAMYWKKKEEEGW
jgi:hypothetical protein